MDAIANNKHKLNREVQILCRSNKIEHKPIWRRRKQIQHKKSNLVLQKQWDSAGPATDAE